MINKAFIKNISRQTKIEKQLPVVKCYLIYSLLCLRPFGG